MFSSHIPQVSHRARHRRDRRSSVCWVASGLWCGTTWHLHTPAVVGMEVLGASGSVCACFWETPLRNFDCFIGPSLPLSKDFQHGNTSRVESTFSWSLTFVWLCVCGAGRGDFGNPRRLPGAWGEERMLKGQGRGFRNGGAQRHVALSQFGLGLFLWLGVSAKNVPRIPSHFEMQFSYPCSIAFHEIPLRWGKERGLCT